MGFNINKAFSNFGKQVKSGFEKFGKNAVRDLSTAGKFIKNEALPEIQKYSGKISQGINYAMPVIGAIAPELLPFAVGASKIAGLVSKGAGVARQGITSGENVVERLKRGDIKGATQAGKDLRGNINSFGAVGGQIGQAGQGMGQ